MAQNFPSHQNHGIDPRSAVRGRHVSTERKYSAQFSRARQPGGDVQTIRQPLTYQHMVPANFHFGTDFFCGNSPQVNASHGMVEIGHSTITAHGPSRYDGDFFDTHPSASFQDAQIAVPGSSSIEEFFPPSSANPGYISSGPRFESRKNQPKLRCEWKDCVYKNVFNRPADLIRHLKTMHVTPHSFRCDIQGCNKTFSRKDNLMEHKLRVHHFVRRA
ncbi:hypothetical protein BO78DRAFT_38605 [Aspergillus sclerotiicarbonarius CBS 121057]|uniref:C2H2-type domain-containing protein n=1 Tax=Aspergillus sclerotiicarbonarius (strain CBS 121057 / IBT 28362) TaxID=1448318 RepID=A0A319EGC8_ASPSB|nr:hypothetical protein BO78DRAFT_38605 [Aspergillus sclerotiicarbonarius CBS 121057]